MTDVVFVGYTLTAALSINPYWCTAERVPQRSVWHACISGHVMRPREEGDLLHRGVA